MRLLQCPRGSSPEPGGLPSLGSHTHGLGRIRDGGERGVDGRALARCRLTENAKVIFYGQPKGAINDHFSWVKTSACER